MVKKFLRDSNLSWVNEVSCSAPRLNWPMMDRWLTNPLLTLGRGIISIAETMLTGHCVICRYAERTELPFNGLCRGCRSAEEADAVFKLTRNLLVTPPR